jgi:hypothetical protein
MTVDGEGRAGEVHATAAPVAAEVPRTTGGFTASERLHYSLPQLCSRWHSGHSVTLVDLSRSPSLSGHGTCTLNSLVHRLMPLHPIVSAGVNLQDVSSIMQYICPPRPRVVPPLPARVRWSRPTSGRVVLWAPLAANGAAESMMQLARQLVQAGVNTVMFFSEFAEYAPGLFTAPPPERLVNVYGHPTLLRSIDGVDAGDVLILRSDLEHHSCDVFQHFRNRGVRVWVWMLSLLPARQSLQPHCSLIAHSHMTSYFRLSESAIIRPFVADRDGLHGSCLATPQLLRKPNVILDGDSFVDNDVETFVSSLAKVWTHAANVHVARDMPPSEFYTLLSHSAVVLDKKLIRQERVPMEAALCGNVVLLGDFMEGSDPQDFPVPPALIFPENDLHAAAAMTAVALECFADLQPLMQPLVQHVLSLPRHMERDVSRLFTNDFHVVVMVCSGHTATIDNMDEEVAALALAVSVVVMLPLSTVELVVDDAFAFRRRHAKVFEVLDAHFGRWSVYVTHGEFMQVGGGSLCKSGAVAGHTPHIVSTGRLLVYARPGDVIVSEDISGRVGVFESEGGTVADCGGGDRQSERVDGFIGGFVCV